MMNRILVPARAAGNLLLGFSSSGALSAFKATESTNERVEEEQ